MIMAGYEYEGKMPFWNVYFTGLVRDKQGRKMSKSLGNSPDPLDLIEKYGADGVRVGMLLCAPAGGDLLFDESLPEQGRNFTTKMWNAFKLVKSWEVADIEQPEHAHLALEWFKNLISKVTETLNTQFDQYRISEALMTVYTTFRDEFSSWLLEIIKPAYGQPIDRKPMSRRSACSSNCCNCCIRSCRLSRRKSGKRCVNAVRAKASWCRNCLQWKYMTRLCWHASRR